METGEPSKNQHTRSKTSPAVFFVSEISVLGDADLGATPLLDYHRAIAVGIGQVPLAIFATILAGSCEINDKDIVVQQFAYRTWKTFLKEL